ncbi:hypothetical protein QVD17_01390 [Tagetes erecta]|uniref:Secreted protein n=1 Tax=Tagetes erecta TaxID=13708 RepID=A0AAD8L7F9_TARER|nr:hypothetical protein QVD17_01390 [Tagetes erecta]
MNQRNSPVASFKMISITFMVVAITCRQFPSQVKPIQAINKRVEIYSQTPKLFFIIILHFNSSIHDLSSLLP